MLDGVKLAGPVFVVHSIGAGGARWLVSVTYKFIFVDGTEAVIARPGRLLWGGADGLAFDTVPGFWQVIAKRAGGVITL